jgi:sodium/bile acid cotransporter 7
LAERYKKPLRYFDQTIILLIVYTSFCDSFERQLFAGVAWSTLALLALAMLALLAFMYTLLSLLSRAWGFDAADEITAVFCGSKKSLVQGAVMSNVLFAGTTGVGLYLLPLMLYHSIQLLAVGMQAARLGKQQQA